MSCLAEEMETPGEDRVKALISISSNPALSSPNGARLSAALDQLEFMVSVDVYLNETTRHADVILPGTSPLEDSHYDVAFHSFLIAPSPVTAVQCFRVSPASPTNGRCYCD
jgi:anaerobic selenocysteine-containing dehydrogenase